MESMSDFNWRYLSLYHNRRAFMRTKKPQYLHYTFEKNWRVEIIKHIMKNNNHEEYEVYEVGTANRRITAEIDAIFVELDPKRHRNGIETGILKCSVRCFQAKMTLEPLCYELVMNGCYLPARRLNDRMWYVDHPMTGASLRVLNSDIEPERGW